MESLFCCVFADCLRSHPDSYFPLISCVDRHSWAAAYLLWCIFQSPIQWQTSLFAARALSSRAGRLDPEYGACPVQAPKFLALIALLRPPASAT